ncbi:hypothetical protein LPJ75_005906, partial [Coemansia sp. RSA 2598]
SAAAADSASTPLEAADAVAPAASASTDAEAAAADSAFAGAPLASVGVRPGEDVDDGSANADAGVRAGASSASTTSLSEKAVAKTAAGDESIIEIAAAAADEQPQVSAIGPVLGPGVPAPIIDGKESVEFQIGNHVVDLFDVLASRDRRNGSSSGRRYNLVHNNALLRHMRDATNNMLRSSPSSTTIASNASEQTRHDDDNKTDQGGQQQQQQQRQGGSGNADDISLTEVLDSLQYVVNFRLKGRQQPHLDAELMRRL